MVALNALYVGLVVPESKQTQGYAPFQWAKMNPIYPFLVLWTNKYSFCLGTSLLLPSSHLPLSIF